MRILLAVTLVAVGALGFTACGGGDDDNGEATGTRTVTARGTATPRTTGTAAPGTPDATGEASDATASDPSTGGNGGSGGLVDPTVAAELGDELTGGNPQSRPDVYGTLPPPPRGVTPTIDPTTIAPANAQTSELQLLLDLDASTPGIQTTREVRVGDIFRVAIVLANAPSNVAAFNFDVLYDRTRLIAPTIIGGPSTDRNPKLNLAAVGGGGTAWDCLPAPVGDRDDPIGISGDGDPTTGQALLSCFTASGGAPAGGHLVLATIEFHAIAPGPVQLSFDQAALAASAGTTFIDIGSCNPVIDIPVPCIGATVTVR